jgi:hypothetical protein
MKNSPLQRRLAKLEANSGVGANPLPILFFHFTKNKTTSSANRAESNGRGWQREPGEGAEDFQARVVADLTPAEFVVWLFD